MLILWPADFGNRSEEEIVEGKQPKAIHRCIRTEFPAKSQCSPIDQATEGIEKIKKAYADQNARENFSYLIELDTGHMLPEELWKRTLAFFRKHLD